MRTITHGFVFLCFFMVCGCTSGSRQQIGDETYEPVVEDPAYEVGKGPAVYIDEAHHNYHTLDGRYQPFAKLLRKDGYRLAAFTTTFSQKELEEVDILVISNALNERNIEDWSLPTPSAFAREEIEAVSRWVEAGGALFLIADHMPMGGAAEELAAKFGFLFYNGFAFQEDTQGNAVFSIKGGTLKDHSVVRGRNTGESVDRVVSFMGQAFEIPADAEPLMVFAKNGKQLLPQTAWEFEKDTKQMAIKGFAQGAVMKHGGGRLAAFGEAAMFTSQLAGPNERPVGMTSPEASQNQQFLLNIMHWLSGDLE